MNKVTNDIRVLKIENGKPQKITDKVVVERMITISVNGHEIANLACIPVQLKELTVGFALTKGIISEKEEIREIKHDGNNVNLKLVKNPNIEFGKLKLIPECGYSIYLSLLSDIKPLEKVISKTLVNTQQIQDIMHKFLQGSVLFRQTGGVHSAAVCDTTSNKILHFADDTSRHFAVDKVLGLSFLQNTSFYDKLLITTGRLSEDIVKKAVRLNIPILLSRSAPTLNAVKIATVYNLTLIGFVRGQRMNVYSGHERVVVK